MWRPSSVHDQKRFLKCCSKPIFKANVKFGIVILSLETFQCGLTDKLYRSHNFSLTVKNSKNAIKNKITVLFITAKLFFADLRQNICNSKIKLSNQ